ncbi:MAG: tartrate dehydrogenase, partial [Mesorhizobium sp.]
MKSYSIALIPGDGIGRDVTAAAWTVLETAAKQDGVALTGTEFPWSCRFYKETGRMMPEDGIETLRGFDA